MTIYDRLIAEQDKSLVRKGQERLYFDRNFAILAGFEAYRQYLDASSPFMVVRANVILRSLANKTAIEKAFLKREKADKRGSDVLPLEEYLPAFLSELPYFALPSGEKNYVPILPTTIALLYSSDPARLLQKPYQSLWKSFEAILIDPFDAYGSRIYDSHFTSLIPILRHGEFLAAYDADALRLYIIDGEGRLEAEVAFFDKKLKNPGKTHLAERLKRVAERYFAFDRQGFLDALLEERLVSASLIRSIEADRLGKKKP